MCDLSCFLCSPELHYLLFAAHSFTPDTACIVRTMPHTCCALQLVLRIVWKRPMLKLLDFLSFNSSVAPFELRRQHVNLPLPPLQVPPFLAHALLKLQNLAFIISTDKKQTKSSFQQSEHATIGLVGGANQQQPNFSSTFRLTIVCQSSGWNTMLPHLAEEQQEETQRVA